MLRADTIYNFAGWFFGSKRDMALRQAPVPETPAVLPLPCGWSPQTAPTCADAQAFLFYCFIFGQSLLFLERGPRKRAQLVAKSAEKLLEEQG